MWRILYSIKIHNMSDQELFDECMNELYPDVKMDKKGCLIHELMERLNPVSTEESKSLKEG